MESRESNNSKYIYLYNNIHTYINAYNIVTVMVIAICVYICLYIYVYVFMLLLSGRPKLYWPRIC